MPGPFLLAQGMDGKFALVNGLNGTLSLTDGEDVVLAVPARCPLLLLLSLASYTARAQAGISSSVDLWHQGA